MKDAKDTLRSCNMRAWDKITDIETLKNVPTEPLGPRHVPVNHGVALDVFKNMLSGIKVNFTKEVGMLSPDQLKYVYAVQVQAQNDDYAFNLGFINYNNKQRSLTGIAGESVFVCSNECYTGQIEDSKRRHTTNIMDDLADKFNACFAYFADFKERRSADITLMKAKKFGEVELGRVVLDLHRKSRIGNTNIDRIIGEWDNPQFNYGGNTEKTAWGFLNSATHVFKGINDPLQRIELNCDINQYIAEACK